MLNKIRNKISSILDQPIVFFFLILFSLIWGCVCLLLEKPLFSVVNLILYCSYMAFSSGKYSLHLAVIAITPSPVFLPTKFPLTFSTITFLFYIFVVGLTFIKGKNKKQLIKDNVRSTVFLSIFFVYGLSVTIYTTGFAHIATAISFCIYSSMPLLAKMDLRSKKEATSIFTALLLFHTFSMLLAVGFQLTDFLGNKFSLYFFGYDSGKNLLERRFYGFCMDPNELAMLSLIAISFSLLSLKDASKNGKFLIISSSIIAAILSFLTQSKSYLICLVLFGLLVLIMLASREPKIVFISLSIVFIGLLAFIYLAGIGTLTTILKRFIVPNKFGETLLDTITTGRFSIWVSYIQFLCQNPFRMIFGYGIRATYYNGLEASPVPHNFLIGFIWDIGIIGTIIYALVSYFLLFDGLKKRPSKYGWLYIPLVVFMVYIFGLTITANTEVHLVLLFTYLLFKSSDNSKAKAATNNVWTIRTIRDTKIKL